MALATIGATVTLSYRGDGFKRCKQGNQKRLAEMIASKSLTVHLESNVTEFTAQAVSIKLKDGSIITIPNDRAFVLIGADTPVVWLEANNVRFVERPHLYALGSTEAVVRRVVPDAIECARNVDEAIAVLRGKQAAPAKKRMRSMVGHIRDEFQDLATSVSQAFRISDLEQLPRRRVDARTPVSGTAHVVRKTTRAATQPVHPTPASRKTGSSAFVPASRLTWDEHTVTTMSPFGDTIAERTSITGTALRPRVHHRDGTGQTTAVGNRALPPRPPPPAAGGAAKVKQRAIARDLDSAFDRAFGGAPAPVKPPPAPVKPPPAPPRSADGRNPFDDDGSTVIERDRLPRRP